MIPQLTILFVLVFAVTHSTQETVWMSFAVGVLAEFSSGVFFGGQIFIHLFTAILAYFVTRKLTDREINWPTVIMLVAGSTLLLPLWIFLYEHLFALFGMTRAASFSQLYSWHLIWTIIINFIFFYPLDLFRRFGEK